MNTRAIENFGAALSVVDRVWSAWRSDSFFARDKNSTARFPSISFAAAIDRSSLGQALLESIAEIDVESLPADMPLTVEVARQSAERWSREEAWYWLAFDPLGTGFYSLFAPTAYSGGLLLNSLEPTFRGFSFHSPGDSDRYVGLVRDYGRRMLDRHSIVGV